MNQRVDPALSRFMSPRQANGTKNRNIVRILWRFLTAVSGKWQWLILPRYRTCKRSERSRLINGFGSTIFGQWSLTMSGVRVLARFVERARFKSLSDTDLRRQERSSLSGALSRRLDFMDIYLAAGETCHPSDNLGAFFGGRRDSGGERSRFPDALAVAYQVRPGIRHTCGRIQNLAGIGHSPTQYARELRGT
jgi:hypothetical protein